MVFQLLSFKPVQIPFMTLFIWGGEKIAFRQKAFFDSRILSCTCIKLRLMSFPLEHSELKIKTSCRFFFLFFFYISFFVFFLHAFQLFSYSPEICCSQIFKKFYFYFILFLFSYFYTRFLCFLTRPRNFSHESKEFLLLLYCHAFNIDS